VADVQRATLVKLGDTHLTIADPAEDVRGRTVIDRNGDEIGTVDGLMIDDREAKVRFLQVGAGGFFGIGEKHFMIPVDAITRVDRDHVHIDTSRDHVVGGPEYDPDLIDENHYYDDVYGYYGYVPWWRPGYVSPAYPHYPAH
jgi:sporulation protein YlmC with PRC-barrel domain